VTHNKSRDIGLSPLHNPMSIGYMVSIV
jgi:hypothetical protein